MKRRNGAQKPSAGRGLCATQIPNPSKKTDRGRPPKRRNARLVDANMPVRDSPERTASSRFAKRQVDAVRADNRVASVFETMNAVVSQARRTSPDHHIAVLEQETLRRVGAP